MGSSKTYPGYLDDELDKLFKYPVCRWRCAICGAPNFYRRPDKDTHGGPAWRVDGHPEWSPIQGPCLRGRLYKLKCATPKGITVMVHEGFEAPSEATLAQYTASGRRQRRAKKTLFREEDGKYFWLPT